MRLSNDYPVKAPDQLPHAKDRWSEVMTDKLAALRRQIADRDLRWHAAVATNSDRSETPDRSRTGCVPGTDGFSLAEADHVATEAPAATATAGPATGTAMPAPVDRRNREGQDLVTSITRRREPDERPGAGASCRRRRAELGPGRAHLVVGHGRTPPRHIVRKLRSDYFPRRCRAPSQAPGHEISSPGKDVGPRSGTRTPRGSPPRQMPLTA